MAVDILCGVEAKTNWSMASSQQKLPTLFRLEHALKVVTAHNVHVPFNFHQEGGTYILAVGQMVAWSGSTSSDPTGLGQLTSILFWGRTGISTRIVTAYIPGKSANKQLSTVKAQHRRHLKSKGDHQCPH
eukprot:5750790-Ditylum_brightwellii.AAC.1